MEAIPGKDELGRSLDKVWKDGCALFSNVATNFRYTRPTDPYITRHVFNGYNVIQTVIRESISGLQSLSSFATVIEAP
jgi:hypothetical protein